MMASRMEIADGNLRKPTVYPDEQTRYSLPEVQSQSGPDKMGSARIAGEEVLAETRLQCCALSFPWRGTRSTHNVGWSSRKPFINLLSWKITILCHSLRHKQIGVFLYSCVLIFIHAIRGLRGL
jgi:hypothetical protein